MIIYIKNIFLIKKNFKNILYPNTNENCEYIGKNIDKNILIIFHRS